MRWYLARGPVPPHPQGPWAAEPWWVAAALSHVPLRCAELAPHLKRALLEGMALEEALQKQAEVRAEVVAAAIVELEAGEAPEELRQTVKQMLLDANDPEQILRGEVVEVAKKMVEWRGRDMS